MKRRAENLGGSLGRLPRRQERSDSLDRSCPHLPSSGGSFLSTVIVCIRLFRSAIRLLDACGTIIRLVASARRTSKSSRNRLKINNYPVTRGTNWGAGLIDSDRSVACDPIPIADLAATRRERWERELKYSATGQARGRPQQSLMSLNNRMAD